jgi:hypothetical protein
VPTTHFCNNCGIYNTKRTYVIQCLRHISVITVVFCIIYTTVITEMCRRHWITYVRIVLYIPQLLQKCVVDTELHMYVLYYIYHSYYRNVSWATYICNSVPTTHFCNNCGIYNTIRTYVIQCLRHISVITVVYIIQYVHM